MTVIERAKKALRERRDSPAALYRLVKDLKREQRFDLACRILELARQKSTHDAQLRVTLVQQHALCTYKNPDAPLARRLDRALEILEQAVDLAKTVNAESLGIAGAIFKRKWLVDNNKGHLEVSLGYYRRGHAAGLAAEKRARQERMTAPDSPLAAASAGEGREKVVVYNGYPGINAAFVLDQLVALERGMAERLGEAPTFAAARLDEARRIREEVVDALGRCRAAIGEAAFTGTWWHIATLAEAHLGLDQLDEARAWMRKATGTPDPWEYQSSVSQLVALARLKKEPGPSLAMLAECLHLSKHAKAAAAHGKVGLALSGGGFRASLFHIGVLAALAEHDMLRHVEVLSCVSGGSILGAYYYLELQQLLESKPQPEITCADYLEIVSRMERQFLEGVQQNLRMRMFGRLRDNWRMFLSRDYSRTQKMGELYEEHLFSRAVPKPTGAGGGPAGSAAKARHAVPPLSGLTIKPKDYENLSGQRTFHPGLDNWRCAAKVPVLLLNASCLNTGHQWQFTSSFMGEPPGVINADVDGNYRLRRMYYDEAPPEYRALRLGTAVGASSCVPAIFEPLQFKGLFDGVSVTLVDGGVHDNQGIVGLLEQSCDHLIVSDASGQMSEDDAPAAGELNVFYRSDTVFQSRMRDLQFADLVSRATSGAMRFTAIHLKKELDISPRDWIGCDDPKQTSPSGPDGRHDVGFTSYGVRKSVQRLLSNIRTDLDSFSDAEAHALMTSGFLMMTRALGESGHQAVCGPVSPWRFYIEQAMRKEDPRLLAVLRQANKVGLKVWASTRASGSARIW